MRASRTESNPRFLIRARAFLFIMLAAAATGCVTGTYAENPMQGSAYGSDILVTVQNNAFSDVVIYANWNTSVKRRVGMVTGKTSETFTIPWQSENVIFEADFIAGSAFYFDPVPVYYGDHLDLVILGSADR